MPSGPEPIESLLLDLHLNRLDSQQVREVEQALDDSAELRDRSRALHDVISLLDHYEAPEPPADLAESVMARINEKNRVYPFADAAAALPAAGGQEMSATPVVSLRELIAIAACITLFVGIFVPGYFKAQNIARRNLCRENIRQIYAGLTAYAQENDGYLAYAGFVPNGSWMPTRSANVPRVSNSKPLYSLVRGDYVPSTRVFICPSAPHARVMVADSPNEFTDFAEPANISYSFQHMNVPRGRRLAAMDEKMVLVADKNPFLDGRSVHQLSPYRGDANSPLHEDGAGQNVIYVSGGGGWYTQPTIGVDQDNIYQAGQLSRYQGTEAPIGPTDTFLVN
jgi:hypothetical protein